MKLSGLSLVGLLAASPSLAAEKHHHHHKHHQKQHRALDQQQRRAVPAAVPTGEKKQKAPHQHQRKAVQTTEKKHPVLDQQKHPAVGQPQRQLHGHVHPKKALDKKTQRHKGLRNNKPRVLEEDGLDYYVGEDPTKYSVELGTNSVMWCNQGPGAYTEGEGFPGGTGCFVGGDYTIDCESLGGSTFTEGPLQGKTIYPKSTYQGWRINGNHHEVSGKDKHDYASAEFKIEGKKQHKLVTELVNGAAPHKDWKVHVDSGFNWIAYYTQNFPIAAVIMAGGEGVTMVWVPSSDGAGGFGDDEFYTPHSKDFSETYPITSVEFCYRTPDKEKKEKNQVVGTDDGSLPPDDDQVVGTDDGSLPPEYPYKFEGNKNCQDLGFDFGRKIEGCQAMNMAPFFEPTTPGATSPFEGAGGEDDDTCAEELFGFVSMTCSEEEEPLFATITPMVTGDAFVIMKASTGGTIYQLESNEKVTLDCGMTNKQGNTQAISHIEFCFSCDGGDVPAPGPGPIPEPGPEPVVGTDDESLPPDDNNVVCMDSLVESYDGTKKQCLFTFSSEEKMDKFVLESKEAGKVPHFPGTQIDGWVDVKADCTLDFGGDMTAEALPSSKCTDTPDEHGDFPEFTYQGCREWKDVPTLPHWFTWYVMSYDTTLKECKKKIVQEVSHLYNTTPLMTAAIGMIQSTEGNTICIAFDGTTMMNTLYLEAWKPSSKCKPCKNDENANCGKAKDVGVESDFVMDLQGRDWNDMKDSVKYIAWYTMNRPRKTVSQELPPFDYENGVANWCTPYKDSAAGVFGYYLAGGSTSVKNVPHQWCNPGWVQHREEESGIPPDFLPAFPGTFIEGYGQLDAECKKVSDKPSEVWGLGGALFIYQANHGLLSQCDHMCAWELAENGSVDLEVPELANRYKELQEWVHAQWPCKPMVLVTVCSPGWNGGATEITHYFKEEYDEAYAEEALHPERGWAVPPGANGLDENCEGEYDDGSGGDDEVDDGKIAVCMEQHNEQINGEYGRSDDISLHLERMDPYLYDMYAHDQYMFVSKPGENGLDDDCQFNGEKMSCCVDMAKMPGMPGSSMLVEGDAYHCLKEFVFGWAKEVGTDGLDETCMPDGNAKMTIHVWTADYPNMMEWVEKKIKVKNGASVDEFLEKVAKKFGVDDIHNMEVYCSQPLTLGLPGIISNYEYDGSSCDMTRHFDVYPMPEPFPYPEPGPEPYPGLWHFNLLDSRVGSWGFSMEPSKTVEDFYDGVSTLFGVPRSQLEIPRLEGKSGIISDFLVNWDELDVIVLGNEPEPEPYPLPGLWTIFVAHSKGGFELEIESTKTVEEFYDFVSAMMGVPRSQLEITRLDGKSGIISDFLVNWDHVHVFERHPEPEGDDNVLPQPTPEPVGDDYPVPEPYSPTPAVTGDPHFVMWSGQKYDFHGGCDLVLLKDPSFHNGKGLSIHIRTKILRWWSFVDSAVVRIGNNTLEVMGGVETRRYFVNKEAGEKLHSSRLMPFTIGGYKVRYRGLNAHQFQFKVFLENDQNIVVKVVKDFVRVDVENPTVESFGESVGLMGSFVGGKMLGRDGQTVLSDPVAFGKEWQVHQSEPMLFHNVEGVQYPEECLMPDHTQTSRRRLGGSIDREQAEIACANAPASQMEDCVFDVMATNDVDMAGAF